MTSFIRTVFIYQYSIKGNYQICADKCFYNKTSVNNLSKEFFKSSLELASLDSFFIFDKKYYRKSVFSGVLTIFRFLFLISHNKVLFPLILPFNSTMPEKEIVCFSHFSAKSC